MTKGTAPPHGYGPDSWSIEAQRPESMTEADRAARKSPTVTLRSPRD